jgi:hypothetical protein
MKNIRQVDRKGQILVIFVAALIGILAFLALIIDGGNLYAKRRAAQNAADAGALAGAAELCLPDNYNFTSIDHAVSQYSTVHNDADTAIKFVEENRGQVTVTTTITTDSFFAHLVGFPELTAQASASAACCPMTSGESILPIAWACRPPIGEQGEGGGNDDCSENTLTEIELQDRLDHPPDEGTIHPELYVVMDSTSLGDTMDFNDMCKEWGGEIPCDLDGDGTPDLLADGNRSWLDLDGGGGGASSLTGWIEGSIEPPVIPVGTWLNGEPGSNTSVFQTSADKVGEYVLIPVFNRICEKDPEINCPQFFEEGDIVVGDTNGIFYRVTGFTAFYITCVAAPGVKDADGNKPQCPGHDLAEEIDALQNDSSPTIEGYFVYHIFGSIGNMDCVNAEDNGAYYLELTK